jgi:hypothetical protein
MDPLTALGLAANIAQFIDFGTSLVSHTKEIGKIGSSVNIAHLKSLTSDLVAINSSLEKQLRPKGVLLVELTKEELVSRLSENVRRVGANDYRYCLSGT